MAKHKFCVGDIIKANDHDMGDDDDPERRGVRWRVIECRDYVYGEGLENESMQILAEVVVPCHQEEYYYRVGDIGEFSDFWFDLDIAADGLFDVKPPEQREV